MTTPLKWAVLALAPAAVALGLSAEWAALQRAPLEQAASSEDIRLAVGDLIVGWTTNDRVVGTHTLVEAAQHAHRRTSPDHVLYESTVKRCGRGRARLTVARKIGHRAFHVLNAAAV